jgi:hypothetical protein
MIFVWREAAGMHTGTMRCLICIDLRDSSESCCHHETRPCMHSFLDGAIPAVYLMIGNRFLGRTFMLSCAWRHSIVHYPQSTLHISTLSSLHSTFRILQSTFHSALHTSHSTQYIPHPTTNTQFYTPHAPSHSVLHASHFTVCNLQCAFPSPFPHFTFQLHIVHCTLYTFHSTLYILHSPFYTTHSPHSTLHTLHTLHTPHVSQFTLHTQQSTIARWQWENTQYCVFILTWYYVNVVGNTATGPSGPSLRAENGFCLRLFDVHARKSTHLINTQAIELISVYGWTFCI